VCHSPSTHRGEIPQLADGRLANTGGAGLGAVAADGSVGDADLDLEVGGGEEREVMRGDEWQSEKKRGEDTKSRENYKGEERKMAMVVFRKQRNGKAEEKKNVQG
jgi:hypothetical protein